MKEHYKGLGHVAIYTADMEQSIAFYEKIGGSVYKRDGVQTPAGEKKLALVEFGGFLLELIEPPVGSLVPSGEGSIPHFTWTTSTRPQPTSRPPVSSRSPSRRKRSCRTPSAVSRTGSSPARPASRSNCSRCCNSAVAKQKCPCLLI